MNARGSSSGFLTARICSEPLGRGGDAMTQRSRRQEPWPWTWELPVGIIVTICVLAMLGVHLGRAIANLLARGGWQFPARADFFNSLPAVLRGDAGAGLTDLHGRLASPLSLLV